LGPIEAAGTGLGADGTGGLVPTFGGAGLDPTPGGGGLGFEVAFTGGFGVEMLPFAPCFAVGADTGLGTATGVGLLVAAGTAGTTKWQLIETLKFYSDSRLPTHCNQACKQVL